MARKGLHRATRAHGRNQVAIPRRGILGVMAGNDNFPTKRPMRRGEAMQRASQGWHLRVTGRTWQQIADELGYANPSNAHRAVMRFAGTIPDPKPDTLRDLWRARMEHLWNLAARDADAGRPGALRAGVAIADRASKFDGLDAPQRFEITPGEADLERLVDEIVRRSGHEEILEADVIDLDVVRDEIALGENGEPI